MSFGQTHYIINFTKWLSIVICSSIYWMYLPFPGKVTTCMLTCFSEMTKNGQVIVSCCTCRSKTSFQILGCSLESGGKVISLLILKWRGNKWYVLQKLLILQNFHGVPQVLQSWVFGSNVHLTMILICFYKVVSVFWFSARLRIWQSKFSSPDLFVCFNL